MGNQKSVPYHKHAEASESVRKRPKREVSHLYPEYSWSNVTTSSISRSHYPHPEYTGPIRFHDIHGINITVSKEEKVASRTNSFCYAIAFTSRPINIEERVRVRLRKVEGGWSGVMRFGFTTNDPGTLQPSELPRYACPDLTNQLGYWAKAMPVRFARQNNILMFYVSTTGSVFFAINNNLEGIILEGVEISKPLWALFDIYGNTTSLELIDRQEVESVSPRESLGLEIGLSEAPVQLPNNMVRSAKIRLQIHEQITPVCFSATMGSGLKCRNRIHVTRKDSIIESTLAFTNTALRPGQTVYFYCAEAKDHTLPLMDIMGFGIGVTTCDPTSIPIGELPFDSMMVMDRPEYWVFYREFEPPEQGEYFALCIERGGYLSYNRSRIGKSVLFHMDTSQPLYILLDLCAKVSSVAIVGMSSESSYPHETEASTSGEASTLFDISNDDPAQSLDFFGVDSFTSRNASNDADVPGPSNYRNAEMEIPVDTVVLPACDTEDVAEEETMPSGVYPHEEASSGVSTSTMAAAAVAAAPIVVSALSWLGHRVVNRLGSTSNETSDNAENEDSQQHSSDGSDNEGGEEAFYNAHEEPEDSSASESDNGSLDTDYRNNVRLLDMLSGDLEEILRPLELTDGAVGGSPQPHVEDPEPNPIQKTKAEVGTTDSKKPDSTISAKECVICFDSAVNAVVYSCGHACLCYECGQVLLKRHRPSCPICRARIKDIIRIYQA